ncbi:MAG: glycoside hydrolase family 32 protein [Planctomycetota bacterium]|nr:glycoside hydrolase family 32 protein [Planctomycetota bacterium]
MRRRIPIILIFALLLLAATGHWHSAEADRPAPVTVKLTPKQEAAAARALRERLLSDPHRPGYHFVIPEGTGMPFDPNGAIFWNGRYHMFYIFQDERGHNWGHVSSTDLCHWRHHPTKLVSGMFSGNCFVNKDGVPTMCYHQVGQGNAMAVALDDNLDDWKKIDSNPITPKTKLGDPHHGKYQSWDPYGWLEGENYYAIFGGKRAAIARAPSLDGPWEYRGDLLARPAEGVDINEDISCADFFKLDGRHVLLCISHDLGARYYLGEWLDEQFYPTHHEQMSWVDNSFFAPESLLDNRGRRIMWAWAKDRPDFKIKDDQHWSGTMSLPRVLSLAPNGTMRMQVPKELERLRYNPKKIEDIDVEGDVKLDIRGDSLELRVLIDPGSAKECGVKVCCSPDGKEETLIYYDKEEKKLKIDTTNSSLKSDIKAIEGGPFELNQGELLTLRIFIDKSIVEVFANDRQAVMRRIYPSRDDSVDVKLFARGGMCKAILVEAWDMMPSNPH